MKIAAQTEKGFLIAVETEELYRLIGFYSCYDQKKPRNHEFKIGDEIQVSAMYQQLYNLAEKQSKLTKIAAELRIVADVLELRDPVIAKLTEVPEVKF